MCQYYQYVDGLSKPIAAAPGLVRLSAGDLIAAGCPQLISASSSVAFTQYNNAITSTIIFHPLAKGRDVASQMAFIPTGDQSKQLIIEMCLPLGRIDSLSPVEDISSDMGGENALHVASRQQDFESKGKAAEFGYPL
jgi:hypothetical protein